LLELTSMEALAAVPGTPDTLPGWLRTQASLRGDAVALRHKRLGVWRPRTWREVEEEVLRLAAVLTARGFGPGDGLIALTHPRPQAAYVALAAQWLGGTVVPLDPTQDVASLENVLERLGPRFAFAEGEEQVLLLRRVSARSSPLALLLFADARGLVHGSDSEILSYEEATDQAATAGSAPPGPVARGDQTAFVFCRTDGAAQRAEPVVDAVTHEDLLQLGRALAEAERLDDRLEALVSRVFAHSAHARYVLAPWLLTGFRINFPENTATRDHDRRELGPTMVVGTAETYGRLERRIADNLPPPGTLRRRLVDWALGSPTGFLRRVLGEWLVRRPLRDVIGFSRVSVPLVVGPPLEGRAAELFSRLGIDVRAWPDPADFRATGGFARDGAPPRRGHSLFLSPSPAIAVTARGPTP
jgi:long-subunit acyl-CoA synthetase (AMP-forming)